MKTAGIIATKNQDKFILESVYSLAYQVDELIVVDDGSIDLTSTLLTKANLPNIKLIHNPISIGVSRAFNQAVAQTNADLIFFQGGDDVSLEGRVQTSLRVFQNNEIVLTYSLPIVIGANGNVLPDQCAAEFQIPEPPDPISHLFWVGNYICAPSVSIRRSDYQKHQGFMPVSRHLQDYALWLELAGEGNFKLLQDQVVKYRKHGANLSREKSSVFDTSAPRLEAELDFILTKFLQEANDETLDNLARHKQLAPGLFQSLSHSEKVMIIQLHHSNKSMIRRGLFSLFEFLNNEKGSQSFMKLAMGDEELDIYSVMSDYPGQLLASQLLEQLNLISRGK